MADRKYRKETMANLRNLKDEDLAHRERDLREELFWLGFKKESGQAESLGNSRAAKKELARILTIQKERSLNTKEASS